MILAIIKKGNESIKGLFTRKEYLKAIKEADSYTGVKMCLSGNTYAERKQALYSIVFDIKEIENEWDKTFSEDLSYGEMSFIYSFLEENAKRYGLLKEFRNECIIGV